jgi:hypothetical protein
MSDLNRIVGCAFAFALVSPAHAEVSSADIARFLDNKPYLYESDAPSQQILRELVANLPRPGFDAAVDAVTRQHRIDRRAAELLAELAMAEYSTPVEERSQAGARLHSLMEQALAVEPDDPFVWRTVREKLTEREECDSGDFVARYFARPGAAREFLAEMDYCRDWILYFAAHGPMSPLAYTQLGEYLEYEPAPLALAASARSLGVIQEVTAPDSPESLYARRVHWLRLADAGLSDELVRAGDALPVQVLRATLDPKRSQDITLDGASVAKREASQGLARELRVQWILALADAQRRTEAQAWFDAFGLTRPIRQARRDSPERRVFVGENADETEFAYQVLAPVDTSDPFDLFIGNGEVGLYWTTGKRTPIAQRASMLFFAARDYADIAAGIRNALCRDPHGRGEVSADELPPDMRELATEYSAKIETARLRLSGCPERRNATPSTQARGHSYVEKALPEQLRTPLRDDEGEDENIQAPGLEGVHLVRFDDSGDVWAAISVSGDVDPTGEIGNGGYWLHISEDQGATWQPPLYLGLQEMQPYVVRRASKLPITNGAMLQLEVHVRELDERSITLPPVDLRVRRSADDVYIERPLAELRRDSDGDGIPDVLEHKIRTDPLRADTDGDGLDDGIDPLPQVSVREPPHPDAAVITQLIQHVLGYDAAAIRIGLSQDAGIEKELKRLVSGERARPARVLFVRADKALFTGMLLPGHIAILDEEDLDYLDANYGIHYPVEFPNVWFNKEHTKGVVHWSARWTGGTLKFTKSGSKWKSEAVSQWIT